MFATPLNRQGEMLRYTAEILELQRSSFDANQYRTHYLSSLEENGLRMMFYFYITYGSGMALVAFGSR